MSEPKEGSSKADAMAHQLKDSLMDDRPHSWKLIVGSLAGCVLLLAILAWWLYPKPKPGPLQIVGLDSICTTDDMPIVRAQLLASPEDKAARSLAGQTVIFHEPPRIGPAGGDKPREASAVSDERGLASAEWAGKESMELLAVYVDPAQNKGSPRERCRVFVWPKDSPLLVVDADETLVGDKLDAKAEAALIQAEADGWRIVYLCAAGADVSDLRKARGWIEKQAKLPRGPILGRARYGTDDTAESVRVAQVATLRDRFKGSLVVVVRNAATALAMKGAGVRTISISNGDPPAGILHAPTWAEVLSKAK